MGINGIRNARSLRKASILIGRYLIVDLGTALVASQQRELILTEAIDAVARKLRHVRSDASSLTACRVELEQALYRAKNVKP